MEFADGGELFDHIVAHSRLTEKQACKFFQQLVAGIEYIHLLGIVHRDLKPENLLLDHQSNIKVVDFGLSNTYHTGELLKTACGSPCYAAPEMIAGHKYEGLKADLWSAGVILFAMVCGYLPFEDSDTSELYKKILAGKYELPDYISAEVIDLLSKILEIEPSQRYTIEQIRGHPWFAQYKQELYPGLLVGYDNIVVDQEILELLNRFSYDVEHTKHCIEANRHNGVTAAYYLLLKKHIAQGGSSIADYAQLNSPSQSPKTTKKVQVVHTPCPPLLDLALKPGLRMVSRKRAVQHTPLKFTLKSRKSSPKSIYNFRISRGRRSSLSRTIREEANRSRNKRSSVRVSRSRFGHSQPLTFSPLRGHRPSLTHS